MLPKFVDGISDNGIYYQRHGAPSSCPLVMIVGYGGTLATWTPAFLEKLSSVRDIIVFDHRGSGRSADVEVLDELTFESIAEDLLKLLIEIGVSNFALMGYSMGGCVALELFRKDPERIQTLILQSTTGGGKLYCPADKDTIDRVNNPRGSTFEEIFFDFISISMPEFAIEKHRKTLEEICDATREPATPVDVLKKKLVEFKKFDASEYLNEIKCPVLIVHGKEDQLMPLENGLNLLKHISFARMLELDRCGHYPHIEYPDELVEAIANFLGHN